MGKKQCAWVERNETKLWLILFALEAIYLVGQKSGFSGPKQLRFKGTQQIHPENHPV